MVFLMNVLRLLSIKAFLPQRNHQTFHSLAQLEIALFRSSIHSHSAVIATTLQAECGSKRHKMAPGPAIVSENCLFAKGGLNIGLKVGQ